MSQGLQLESLRPWRLVVWRLSRVESAEEPKFLSNSEGLEQKFPYSTFSFYPGLQLIGLGPSALERVIYFTQLSIQMLISSRHILTYAPRTMESQISGQFVTQSAWNVKLATIDYMWESSRSLEA